MILVHPNQATHCASHNFPQAKRKAVKMERSHDARLASLFSKTEIMVLAIYQNGHLSQRRGQALMDIIKHPVFRLEDIQVRSATIVHLIRRLERPFKATTVKSVVGYNFWKEGVGDQNLEMVMHDYLECAFRAGRMILFLSFVPFLMTLAIV